MQANPWSVSRSVRMMPGLGGPDAHVGLDRVTAFLVAGFLLMTASVVTGKGLMLLAMAVVVTAVIAACRPAMLRWSTILGVLLAVILFVPIGRYSLPINLPFGVELYRIVVALVVAVWAGSLLIDPHVRLRGSPFDRAIAVIVCATLGSVIVNIGRVVPLQSAVVKSIMFFLSFVLVYYFVVSVVRTRRTVESLTKFLVGGTAVVAVFAIVEQRTHFNVFDHESRVLPFVRFTGALEAERGLVGRAIASSAHPIALGVLLAVMLPVSLALVFSSSRRWWIPTGLIAIGMMSTVSRTPIITVVAAGLILIWLRPRDVKRLLPLIVPLIVVVKIAMPGSLATVKAAFLPEGGIIAEQSRSAPEADPNLAGGRARQLVPMLREASRTPLLGQGQATRQTGLNNPLRNAPILDNQWLGLLLEIGIVGVAGWVALLSGAVRALGRASRRRAGPDGWLEAGFAASVCGLSIAMFTLDSFAYVQTTFVMWIILALGAVLLLAEATPSSTPLRAESYD